MKNNFLKIILCSIIFSSYSSCNQKNNLELIKVDNYKNANYLNLNNDKIVFYDENYDQNTDNIELASNSNNHVGSLFSRFKFSNTNKQNLINGELYKTKYDTQDSLKNLKEFIINKANNNTLYPLSNYDNQEIDYGNFNIGSAFVPLKNKTTIRAMSCVYNNNIMGVLTDYENIFVLNNPTNKETFYLLVTHQTYLSPTQTSNRNYKGVGVEFKLSKDKSSYAVTRYAPTTSAPSKITSYSYNFGYQIGEQNSLGANISFSYQKEVSSPTIASKGSISQGIVDIAFEYVEPGSWHGDFCNYNSNETFQCSLVVLESSKSLSEFNYISSVTGRFQKYENWPFPWVDEYYTINLNNNISVSEILSKIA